MKRFYYIIRVLILFLSLTFFSCSDFLKEVSQDEFYPETTKSLIELLNGEGYYFFETVDPWTLFLSDDVNGIDITTTETRYQAIKDVFTWQPFYYQSLLEGEVYNQDMSTYENFYKKISVCNIVIELTEDSDGSDSDKYQLLGEAYTLRAYYYFYLLNIYSKPYNDKNSTPETSLGVPLITKAEILETGPKRNTVKEVYDQIIKDINQAIEYLEREKREISIYRINHISANLLASRIYLYLEDWDKVIEHSTYALRYAPQLVNLPNYQLSNATYPINATNQVCTPSFSENIFLFSSRNGSMWFHGTPICVSADLYSSYTDPNDSRIGKYIWETPGYMYPYAECKTSAGDNLRMCLRTAELYLNRAEAYMEKFRNGDNSSGQLSINDLNELRRNRISNYTDYSLSTVEDLQNLCRLERRRELCFEYHRWFDLRRYGMPQISHTWYDNGIPSVYTLYENDPGYVMPLPDSVLERNPNLEQNELTTVKIGTAN